jgi:hypothetical protein
MSERPGRDAVRDYEYLRRTPIHGAAACLLHRASPSARCSQLDLCNPSRVPPVLLAALITPKRKPTKGLPHEKPNGYPQN